jgi:hypothetical protein
MQKGKALHCALPLKVMVRSWGAIFIMIASLAPGSALGIKIVDHPLRPMSHLDPFVSLVSGVYMLCYSSCAEPYGIDDLHIYRALLGARTERFALWAAWDECGHPLYRLDELRLRICMEASRLPVSMALEPALRREAVKGFPARNSAGIAAVVILCRRGIACSLKREFAGQGGESPVLLACSARLDRLSITAAGCLTGGGFDIRETEAELSIDGIITLWTGYHLDAKEIRCGIGCRRRGILVTACWAHHPALGRTISLGVGYVWPR